MQALRKYIMGGMRFAGSEDLGSFWVGAAVIAIVPGAGILWLIWCFVRARDAGRTRSCPPNLSSTSGASSSH